MAMEKYVALSSDVSKAYVSFHTNSHVRFSSGFVKKYKVKVGYMSVYYDGDTDEVGFVFTKEYEEGALKVTKTAKSKALSSSLVGFVKVNALELDSRRYDKIRVEGDMVILDLEGIK
jgi:hypothetical protein